MAKVKSERTVLYPEVKTQQFVGAKALKAAKAMDLLGWEEVQDGNYLFRDMNGVKVRCSNNLSNRPFDLGRALQYAQDILTKKWCGPSGNGASINGETMIIGKTGMTLSCQHRLVALVLAKQMWDGVEGHDQSGYWQSIWETEPVMDALITFGVDEGAEVTRTLDSGKSRDLADVLFCDPTFFGKKSQTDRLKLCRIAKFAIPFLWNRIGLKKDLHISRLTNSEMPDFLRRHGKIRDCIGHVWGENAEDSLSSLHSLGELSGLTYLFACSASDGNAYRHADSPSERKLDFSNLDKAEEYIVALSAGNADVVEVRKAISNVKTRDIEKEAGEGGTPREKVAILIKGWAAFLAGGPVTKKDLKLEYEKDEETGRWNLVDRPCVEGIDTAGEPPDVANGEEEDNPEEVEQRKEEVHQEKLNGNSKKGKKTEPKEEVQEETAEEVVVEVQEEVVEADV